MTVRRALAALGVLVLLAVAYSAWQAWRVERSLTDAESSGERLIDAVRAKDPQARDCLLYTSDAADE